MKKLMCIFQITLFALMATSMVALTVGSIAMAGEFYAWQVALGVLCGLSILLIGMSIREYKKECNEQ
jgi:hypothetical protein